MDALSEVLSLLKVRSGLSSRFEGEGAWAFRFPAYQHMKFGTVLRGRLYLRMAQEADYRPIEEGDVYLLTNGQPFCSASVPGRAPRDGPATYRSIRGADGVVRFRGPGRVAPVSLASGRFIFENDVTSTLLGNLPPLIHLRAADVAAHALSHVLALLKLETGDPAPGSDVVKTSLATLVLVQALRAYMAGGEHAGGWLKALSDARVGSALSMMHGSPDQRWTIESLASGVGMSRTAFASRFRSMVGSAPLAYLHRWRMAIAMTALKDSEESLMSIAVRIGYLSDTAFSIAFKRATGISPGRYRMEQRR
ncbi:AraC family transcriptional regulator [Paraburkholderia silviterrae]|uniref:AraC family transcriptional regulator n=1 Tax=Paraburkholderia silviterrae TaxID=2528715 RepID=A0A4R5MG31_9BURK|nr:AraC family transcriptional regulator [Paraburkholderia silviterrae]TDG26202.1 AraC family transcriptional regulator [Paraburkholderia silviterrae]